MVLKGVQEIASIRPLSGTARKKKTARQKNFTQRLASREIRALVHPSFSLSLRGSWFPVIDPALRGCEAGFYRFTIGRPCLIEHEGYESALNALLVVDIQVSHPTGGVFPNCDLNAMFLVEMLHSPAPPPTPALVLA